MLQRLARAMYRRRRRVLVGWVLLLAGLVGLNATAGGEFLDDFTLPGSESQQAADLLRASGFGDRAGANGQVAFRADQGVDDPAVRQAMTALFAELEAAIPDTELVSPYTSRGSGQRSRRDPRIAYAQLNLGDRNSTAYQQAGQTARDLVDQVQLPGLQVELGGDTFAEQSSSGSEGTGFLAAMVILLGAFGSLLAMGLPLLTALFGIGTGISLVGLAVNLIDMPSFSDQAVLMIGIGVGIDYALFIVTRYREGLQAGLPPEQATVRAVDTAGRAVLFAGSTVIIAILGLFTLGLDMIRGLAAGIILGVLMTMLAALTLLPAVLGFVGHHIDRLGLPHRRHRHGADQGALSHRWSRLVQRRPWPALLVGALVLAVLTLPMTGLRLGFGDAGNRPTTDTTRRAYDLLADGFGPGFNGPLLLVAQTPAARPTRRPWPAWPEPCARRPG
jgi:RND superfamily putative drug exporter